MRVRIKATPPGEAPEHIRAAWVGLELPIARPWHGPQRAVGFGVLHGPKSLLGQWIAYFLGRGHTETGYIIDANLAVERLAAKSPVAAAWWREHAPHALAPGRYLLFAAEACEEIDRPEEP